MARALWFPKWSSYHRGDFWRRSEVVEQRLDYMFSTRLDYIAAVINDNERWPLHVLVD